VVYNHTGEGGERGPTLCYRGIDNASYYRLLPHDRGRYADFSGCGNALDVRHPRVLQLVVDSLRYWVSEMHVDGFRVDLAPALARDDDAFDANARLFALVQQDPVLCEVKWIAEPWDLGPGGYQLGHFPPGWAEWNGRYRDCVRRYWRGDRGQVPELASRLSGSSDLFRAGGRGPFASVNFVTCHDGFTLRDLVSYERKHNEANGEANRDGSDANWSRNWGVEGETESREIQRQRARIARNLLATLAFSQGVPMLSHGDELGRTQRGNNNAYCHDDETTWVDWRLSAEAQTLLDFTRRVFALRRENPVFRRRRFFAGDPLAHAGVKDVTWLRPDGGEMTEPDWQHPELCALGMLVHGDASDEVDERGRPNRGATLLLVLNGGDHARRFRLPRLPQPGGWRERVNTADEDTARVDSGSVQIGAHTLALFEHDGARRS
jgi:glycogen operon protein